MTRKLDTYCSLTVCSVACELSQSRSGLSIYRQVPPFCILHCSSLQTSAYSRLFPSGSKVRERSEYSLAVL